MPPFWVVCWTRKDLTFCCNASRIIGRNRWWLGTHIVWHRKIKSNLYILSLLLRVKYSSCQKYKKYPSYLFFLSTILSYIYHEAFQKVVSNSYFTENLFNEMIFVGPLNLVWNMFFILNGTLSRVIFCLKFILCIIYGLRAVLLQIILFIKTDISESLFMNMLSILLWT
jgi:hypothetical protein